MSIAKSDASDEDFHPMEEVIGDSSSSAASHAEAD
jgi:hypothetical protein